MVVFLLQSLFLIAAAFVIGAILGNLFKRMSPKRESVSEVSTRAADARLAASPILPANDDVRQSAREAAAMIPPAEPVPPAEVSASGKPARRTAAKRVAAKTAVERRSNPRQDDSHRPVMLKAARRGKPDKLTDIDGIGTAIQSRLFDLGLFHFDQIAGWSIEEAAWVGEEIGFPGRVQREGWIRQAAARVKMPAADQLAKPKPTARRKAGTTKPS
ncbi:hypothetical protein HQ945_02460 [Phyllobacterium sp. BT25]|uniref:NADH-quinone oxidoreductase subunit E n=1 Tax=Phyllobacterium pellucidum TaxID=2740464 RepID=A0A849VIS8_9HYPH|nr:hypothetical protein [Phyllobacterium pellucidum]NTS30105.1 hypothetical protein [Phyllobacterium pellucidum]